MHLSVFDSDLKVWNHGNQNIVFIPQTEADYIYFSFNLGLLFLKISKKKVPKFTSLLGEFIYLELSP